jgi:phage-related tail fiber protein
MPSLKDLWFLKRRNALRLEDIDNIGELSGAEFAALLQAFVSFPTGLVLPWAASVVYVGGAQVWQPVNPVPPGWLLANGQAVGRTEYRRLFEAIGTSFGVGDGSTTFNVPNLVDRYIKGVGTTGGLNVPGGALDHTHPSTGDHVHATSLHGHGGGVGGSNSNRFDISGGGGLGVARDNHGHSIASEFVDVRPGGGHSHGGATSHDPSHIHLLHLIKT